ncbi:9041_t:CDS:1, partial [Paraglomus occultum]
VEAILNKIKGHLVIFPTQFLENEELQGVHQTLDDLILLKLAG